MKELSSQIIDDKINNCAFQIVVINDGSTDETVEWLTDNYPEHALLHGDGSLWWSGGINLGARYAISEIHADYLLLWNNDILPASDYFRQVDRLIPSLSEDVIVGSKILLLGEQDLIWSYGGMFNPRTGKKYMLGSYSPDSDEFAVPQEVDWLPGMGTMVPAGIVEDIGLWDDVYFPQYHGDSDYTLRAKTKGYKNIVFPQLRLWNDKSSSGLTHNNTLKGLYQTLTDIKSGSEIKKNVLFYKRHATSIIAYKELFKHYIKLIGGFFKWKLLALFGKKKNHP